MSGLIYLAGPIDMASDSDVLERARQHVKADLMHAGFAVFDPMASYTGAPNDPVAVESVNAAAIERSVGVYALLPDGIPTYGTPMEIYRAAAMGLPVAVQGGLRSVSIAALHTVRTFEWGEYAGPLEYLKGRTVVARTLNDFTRLFGRTNGHGVAGAPLEAKALKWTGDEDCAPTRHFDGDAGFDLYVAERTSIPYGKFVDVPLGISVELPPGTWAQLTGRSSTLRKRNLLVTQGVIDNGYRGELFAGVQNLGREGTVVDRGERIAQLILHDMVTPDPVMVSILSETDRGAAGFGSTGV